MVKARIPETMAGVVLKGHGGLDKLEFRDDLPTPRPGKGEVLIRVKAAGVNNTDINTRIGWYSKAVSEGTNTGGLMGLATSDDRDASWSGQPIKFPRIQGADCYGEIVAVGEAVDEGRVGEAVLVRTLLRAPVDSRPFECWAFGSECDGGFAEYAVAPSADVFPIEIDLSDVELGAIPCAYSTAENMLVRAAVVNDLSLYGCTAQEDIVFENIVGYLREGRIRPLIAATFPLAEIRRAQEMFLKKRFVGKIVLIP